MLPLGRIGRRLKVYSRQECGSCLLIPTKRNELITAEARVQVLDHPD